MTNSTPPDESSTDKLRRLIASESKPASGTEPEAKPAAQPGSPPAPPGPPPASTPQPDSETNADATPVFPRVSIDEHGMPLPKRVPEQDPDATRVQSSAIWYWDSPKARRQHTYQPDQVLTAEPLAPTRATAPQARRWAGCLWKVLVNAVIAGAFALFLTMGALGYAYWAIARDLPPIGDLRQRASQFETTRVYDSRGQLLQDIADPQSGFRTRVALNQVSPYLLAATIATEDKNFFSHPGFDPIGILRAIFQNVQAGDTVSGASTITQQLVRALVLSPEERGQRTAMRKVREIILAAEITRRYSKKEILELYLNEIYYGNLDYGIEAASETYFNKKASDLTLAEASFLAGLPQAPAIYDVYTDPEAAFARQRDVLFLMLALSDEANCIRVDPEAQTQRVCVTANDVIAASGQIHDSNLHPFVPPHNDARFPHWVNYIRQLLEEQYGAQTVYRSGYNVYTTLDPDLQAMGEQTVAGQVAALADRNVTNGALVAVRPDTGEIVAMIGSDNYDDPVDGQINMAIRPRQPGSSIKPLTYALAFERGWTPATLIWDVPSEFPDGANPPYKPVNYDGRFHGPVLVRYALANSYNIPAVKALQFVGLYEDGGFLQFAPRLGITTLDRPDYGLSVTLGGGEVPLLQMVGAYATLAHDGLRVFPIAIREIRDSAGNLVCQQPLHSGDVKTDPPACQAPPENWGAQAVSAENAYLISHILSDNDARAPAFGPNSQLRLSFEAAAKTGTTNDYRDNWTIGYTPDLAVGVWVGNADFTPMERTTGVTGAAPIWHNFMEAALAGKATPFTRPPGVVERAICAISGAEPSEFCPPNFQRAELFVIHDPPQPGDHPPLPKERDLWRQAFIDPFSGLEQTADCATYYQNDVLFNQGKTVVGVSDPWAQKWLTDDPNGQAWATEHGINPPIAWAPTGQCTADSPHPIMSFAYPPEGANIPTGPIQIIGQAAATGDFNFYIVEYGISHDPQGWGPVLGPNSIPVSETGPLANWDAGVAAGGPVTLRVVVYSRSGGSAEARVHFYVQAPTPSPTPTVTATSIQTSTVTPTATPTVTLTPTASDTPLATETPTQTPAPSETPTPTPTDTPTATP